jgi:leucyl/phenylalanyl-tRNA--protein transferase
MKSPQIKWISSDDPPDAFPDIESAFEVPDGLLAAGGDLSQERLLYAYRHGIFPWFDDGQPILWWSPDPRCVLHPGSLRLSRRTLRSLNKLDFTIQFNTAFDDVVAGCAAERAGQPGTWITPEMRSAYRAKHAQNWAHSIEVWTSDGLIGGLYGLAIDKVFFGESMFSRESNASKAAMLALCHLLLENNFSLLDCQVESSHLLGLGATLMPRRQFSSILRNDCARYVPFASWPAEPLNISEFLPGN